MCPLQLCQFKYQKTIYGICSLLVPPFALSLKKSNARLSPCPYPTLTGYAGCCWQKALQVFFFKNWEIKRREPIWSRTIAVHFFCKLVCYHHQPTVLSESKLSKGFVFPNLSLACDASISKAALWNLLLAMLLSRALLWPKRKKKAIKKDLVFCSER